MTPAFLSTPPILGWHWGQTPCQSARVAGVDANADAPSGSLQEAIFNKSTGKVTLKTFSLYRKLLTLSRAGHDQGEAGEGG